MPTAARDKPALLCVTPYFGNSVPPAGAAALLSFLHQNGCSDFAFTDFRTWLPYRCRTFSEMGAFAETFVLDVPELPIVLTMLRAFREGKASVVPERDQMFDGYCMRRLLNPKYVHQYLVTMENFFAAAWQKYDHVKFVGFTTWTTNYLSTLIAAAQLKRTNPEAYVVAGGPQVTESKNAAALGIRAKLFDAVVFGEGEQALFDLYTEFVENGQKPGNRQIPGVLKDGPTEPDEAAAKRKLLHLKNLPPPRFDEINLSSYAGWREHGMLPYQLSRGCTDKCSFCSEWVFWQQFRLSKPDSSIEQISELQQRYKLRHVSFTDSLINGVERRLEAFADSLLTQEIKVTWGGFMRAQMTPDLAALIARAGCNFAFVGVESLADETLDSMNKRRTGVENVKAIEALISADIPVEIGLITGFPGDSRERFMETVGGVVALQSRFPGKCRVSVESFRPTPNQPIYKKMHEFGLEPAPWDAETLDIDPHFADITSEIHCSVSGSNQGVDRLGELHYVGKVIKSGPKPSSKTFAVGWGRPEVLDFEDDLVKFRYLNNEDLYEWCSVRALHPDGSVRFLMLNDDEVTRISSLLKDIAFGCNPFDTPEFADTWSRFADEHVISGSIHPQKAATHRFQTGLQTEDVLLASPYWTARIVDAGNNGLVLHQVHDLVKTYRTSPALASALQALAREPMALDDIVKQMNMTESRIERGDAVSVLEYAHELGFLSVI